VENLTLYTVFLGVNTIGRRRYENLPDPLPRLDDVFIQSGQEMVQTNMAATDYIFCSLAVKEYAKLRTEDTDNILTVEQEEKGISCS
jgi:hypothetical protein